MIPAILVMQAMTLGILSWGVIGNWLDARRRRRELVAAQKELHDAFVGILDRRAGAMFGDRLTNQEPS